MEKGIDHLNSTVPIRKIKFLVKNLPTEKNLDPLEFYQICKKK